MFKMLLLFQLQVVRTLIAFLTIAIIPVTMSGQGFVVQIPSDMADVEVNGRMFVMLSVDNSAEPRFQISDGPNTQLLFGIDVEGASPGDNITVGAEAFGYPIERLADVPEGEYFVQALFHKYEVFHRGDGHTVIMPMDRGEGQHWNLAPGNRYSTPKKMTFNPRKKTNAKIQLENEIPAIEEPKDTKYVKHIKIKSELLSKFWGATDVPGRARATP